MAVTVARSSVRRAPMISFSAAKISLVLIPLLTLVVSLVITEIVLKMLDVKPYIIPLPSAVFEAMWTNRDLLLPEAGHTLYEMVVGYVIAVVVGISLAMMIVASTVLERAIYPLLIVSHVIPSIALAPIFLIWFGTDALPKIILVAFISFFPIVVNTIIGLRSMELEKAYLAQTMGAGSFSIFLRFRMPSALPAMFAGLKLAATACTIGAVVGEFMGGSHGLGFVMLAANGGLNTKVMFAAIGYVAILGLGFFGIVTLLERLTIPWHAAARKADRDH